MNSLNSGSDNVDGVYVGDRLIAGNNTKCNTDKYLAVLEGNTVYFIDVETLQCLKKVVITEGNGANIKSFGKILKVTHAGKYELYINSMKNKTSEFTDNYGDYSDVYCEDNVVAIAKYNFDNDYAVTLEVNYPISAALSKTGDLGNIGYNDEGILILGKYRNWYVITFYYCDKLYLVNEETLAVSKIVTPASDHVNNIIIVDGFLYGLTIGSSADPSLFKIDSNKNIVKSAINYYESEDGEVTYTAYDYLFYFDDKIVTYDSSTTIAYDKDLNLVYKHYDDSGDPYATILLVNGELWLVKQNGDITIRKSYNDTNKDVVRTLTKDDGSNFTNIKNVCTTEIDFN